MGGDAEGIAAAARHLLPQEVGFAGRRLSVKRKIGVPRGAALFVWRKVSVVRLEDAWQERLASEAVCEQSEELLLGLGELGAERTEALSHGGGPAV